MPKTAQTNAILACNPNDWCPLPSWKLETSRTWTKGHSTCRKTKWAPKARIPGGTWRLDCLAACHICGGARQAIPRCNRRSMKPTKIVEAAPPGFRLNLSARSFAGRVGSAAFARGAELSLQAPPLKRPQRELARLPGMPSKSQLERPMASPMPNHRDPACVAGQGRGPQPGRLKSPRIPFLGTCQRRMHVVSVRASTAPLRVRRRTTRSRAGDTDPDFDRPQPACRVSSDARPRTNPKLGAQASEGRATNAEKRVVQAATVCARARAPSPPRHAIPHCDDVGRSCARAPRGEATDLRGRLRRRFAAPAGASVSALRRLAVGHSGGRVARTRRTHRSAAPPHRAPRPPHTMPRAPPDRRATRMHRGAPGRSAAKGAPSCRGRRREARSGGRSSRRWALKTRTLAAAKTRSVARAGRTLGGPSRSGRAPSDRRWTPFRRIPRRIPSRQHQVWAESEPSTPDTG